MKRILWLGFGDIAERAVPNLLASGFEITALSRSPRRVPEGIQFHQGLADDEDMLSELLAKRPQFVVLTLTPADRSDAAYRRSYLAAAQALARCLQRASVQPDAVLFVSSTGVYHQNDGQWVDEESVTEPTRDSAKVLLAAEHAIGELSGPSCCLRFSGIYGPGRYRLLQRVLAGYGGGDNYTNRIHVEDCAHIIAFLIELAARGGALPRCLVASDDRPASAREVRAWLAQQLQLPSTHLQAEDTAESHRRCRNQQLKALGYRLRYPSYREGFIELVRQFRSQQQ